MDPDPKIILSNFVFWTTSPSDILPPAADLKISFGRNGESFGIASPLKRCDEVWTDLGLGLVVPASGILAVDVLQAGYSVPELDNSDRTYSKPGLAYYINLRELLDMSHPVPNLENSDRTHSKLGSAYVDLGELLRVDMSDDVLQPEMCTTSGAVRYATTVVMEADYLPILHCSMAVTRFSSFPVGDSLSPLYLPFQICADVTSDGADFKRYAEELEGFLGASNGEILLTVVSEQVRNITCRCLSMRNYHDRIDLTALFAGVLNDQFLLRSRIQTHFLDTNPHSSEEEMFSISRLFFCMYGPLAASLEGSHQTDFSDGLLDLPDTNSTKILRIQSLGWALTSRGDEEHHNDLTRGIFFLETVKRLRLDTSASDFVHDQFSLYRCMFRAYFRLYQRSNNVLDIDKALLSADEARKLIPPLAQTPEEALEIAAAFATRYDHSNEIGDMHKAAEIIYEALIVALPHRDTDSPSYLGILQRSAGLFFRYCQVDRTADRTIAILCHEKLLSLLPRGDCTVARTIRRLMTLYSSGGDYDHAIQMGKDFVDANPNRPDTDLVRAQVGHHLLQRLALPWYLNFPADLSLVISLNLEEQHVLDEAITLLSCIPIEALHTEDDDTLGILAGALYLRYEFGGKASKDLSNLNACISILSCRATSPLTHHPSYRFLAASTWASFADSLPGNEGHSRGMVANRTMMSLLPSVLWMGIGLQNRHEILARARGACSWEPLALLDPIGNRLYSMGQIPNSSAAFAIRHGEYCAAIEWLEQGRSIIWDQMLQLRVSLESLQLVDKQLAERLGAIGRELAISTARSGSWATRMDDAGKEEEGQKHRRLTHDWETGVAEVRRLPGFEDFLASKNFAYLSRAADDCTVIIINTHYLGVDALVLFPPAASDGQNREILHVPLDGGCVFDLEVMRHRIITLGQPSSPERKQKWRPNPNMVRPTFNDSKGNRFDSFEVILSGLWYEIVLPILVRCNQARPDLFSGSPGVARPRVRWCPTGPLSFLPLHAAGDYTKSDKGHKVYDFLISSYIPTLNSVIRDNPTSSRTYVDGTKPKIVAVSCAMPKGYPPIIGTQAELGKIQKHAHLAGCELTAVTEQDATADRVLEEITNAHWVHFACHGVQDTKIPTQSALILQNGTRATLSDFAALDLPHAELAYLSACETATGFDAVPSESIHLAAGMLLAGFRSVIATMWTIEDRHAPDVADSVYGYLLRREKSGSPDYKESAVALDLAVQRLREEVGEKNFISWVPYIHIGA